MPDGDRFERRLGKLWKKAYRLACGNASASDPELLHALVKAAANDIQEGLSCPALAEIANALFETLTAQPRLQFEASSSNSMEAFRILEGKLEKIEAREMNFPGTRFAIKAVLSIYPELKSSEKIVSSDQVRNRLSEKFFAEIIDSQFFGRVRDGLIQDNSRSNPEQASWELQVLEQVKSQARKFLKPAFQKNGPAPLHTPRRSGKQQRTTKDWLSEPLNVLGVKNAR